MTDLDEGPHAVRWALREVGMFHDIQYCKWHYTEDSMQTDCGWPVRIAVATLFPDVDLISRVDCKRCLNKMKGVGIEIGEDS